MEPAERAREDIHAVTCYHLPAGTDGATQIGSKRTFQTKLFHGLASSRVAAIFAVPRPLIVHVPTRFDFHIDTWAAGPYETLP
jgi:hypothetical protein